MITEERRDLLIEKHIKINEQKEDEDVMYIPQFGCETPKVKTLIETLFREMNIKKKVEVMGEYPKFKAGNIVMLLDDSVSTSGVQNIKYVIDQQDDRFFGMDFNGKGSLTDARYYRLATNEEIKEFFEELEDSCVMFQ